MSRDEEEGGRHNPFTTGYAPQFYFCATDVTGRLDLGDLTVMHPGDRATVHIELMRPVGMEVGTRFAIREGSRTVGAGIVTAIR